MAHLFVWPKLVSALNTKEPGTTERFHDLIVEIANQENVQEPELRKLVLNGMGGAKPKPFTFMADVQDTWFASNVISRITQSV